MICSLCPHHCSLSEGQVGRCQARGNKQGEIVCLNYGRLTACALDPIEKKPLAQFFPGSKILSVGSFGCNLSCPYCQNSEIATADRNIPTSYVSPEELVKKAIELKANGNIGLAFTYNEPLISYEYIWDCAQLAKKRGLKIVLVSNGMICDEPLQKLVPFVDAWNIDLKGFSQKFYDFVGGDLATVKNTIEVCAKNCHLEVTTLIIPGYNDTEEEMVAESLWLAEINSELPLHLSRFFPCYKLADCEPTDVDLIYRLRNLAAENLKYVYVGNC